LRGRWAAKSTDLRLCETGLVIRRLYSRKSLSGNSYVAITSASKKIALVTSVALMIPPKAPSIGEVGQVLSSRGSEFISLGIRRQCNRG
jgi:hypothetical protein